MLDKKSKNQLFAKVAIFVTTVVGATTTVDAAVPTLPTAISAAPSTEMVQSYTELPNIEVKNAHEIKYDMYSGQPANTTEAQKFNTQQYDYCLINGKKTVDMAYWDLTTGEYSGVNIDTNVDSYTNPVLLLDLFIYDQRSKGLINGSDTIQYKGTTRTVAEVQKLATATDDLEAFKALNKFCGTKKAAPAFVKAIIGDANLSKGLTAKQNILVARRVLAFIQSGTPLAKEFESLLQDGKTGDIVTKSNVPASKVLHRQYFNSSYGVLGDMVMVTGEHPFVMFVQFNNSDDSHLHVLTQLINNVYEYVNGN